MRQRRDCEAKMLNKNKSLTKILLAGASLALLAACATPASVIAESVTAALLIISLIRIMVAPSAAPRPTSP